MTDLIEEPTLKVFGFVSDQGTAMSGTGFCEDHSHAKDEALDYAKSQNDADPAFKVFDVSENEMMYCGFCGLNGYRETYPDDDDM